MLIRNSLRLILQAVLVVLLATAAQATTFDFTGSSSTNGLGLGAGDLAPSLDLELEGISLTVSAYDETGAAGYVNRVSNGLGVRSDPWQDAVGLKESLVFEFAGPAVTVEGLIFERGDMSGTLELYIDDVYQDTIAWATGGGTMVLHDLGSIAGNRFELVGNRNGFRVGQITVVDGIPPVVSAIPEPNAALVFGLGLVVVGRATRRD